MPSGGGHIIRVGFLGLVPKQNSSGGKERLGRISKMGDPYLRTLLVNGATSVVRRIAQAEGPTAIWIRRLLEKKPVRLATVAIANKTTRIVWAVMARGEEYRRPAMGRNSLRPLTCHGSFPPSAIRVRPMERTDDEEGTTDGRADHWHLAGA